jgi:hypothetical protein
MRADMKMTPIVGDMKAVDMAMALGKPRALRFSSLALALSSLALVPVVAVIQFPPVVRGHLILRRQHLNEAAPVAFRSGGATELTCDTVKHRAKPRTGANAKK